MSENFVAYYRVSTAKQGKSGLGLEAQMAAAVVFMSSKPQAKLLASFTEVESGKKDDRVQLHRAIEHCKLTGSTLLIAKLDRLSRDAYFLLGLQRSGVRFVCCDMPHADNFTVGIMAMVAQQEREAISKRTKEALAAAKARGVKLGCPNGAKHLQTPGAQRRAVLALKRQAKERALKLKDTFNSFNGLSAKEIAERLELNDYATPRGGKWQARTVRTMMARISA